MKSKKTDELYGVIRADYFSYQVPNINPNEFLAKVIEINAEIQRQIEECFDGKYESRLMDEVVEEFFPDAHKSDMMDLVYDYLYLLETDGVLKWGTATDKKLTTV